jgi:hypothetical protein
MRLKIGYTTSKPEARLKALQTGSPTVLKLMAVHPGTLAEERKLHEQFSESRLHGEWFEPSEEIVTHMQMICWLAAAIALDTDSEVPHWAKVGLFTMNEEKPLPDYMQAAIQ